MLALWEMPVQENRTAALLILWMVFLALCAFLIGELPWVVETYAPSNFTALILRRYLNARTSTSGWFISVPRAAEGNQEHYVPANLIKFPIKLLYKCILFDYCLKKLVVFLYLLHLIMRNGDYSQLLYTIKIIYQNYLNVCLLLKDKILLFTYTQVYLIKEYLIRYNIHLWTIQNSFYSFSLIESCLKYI